MHTHISTHASTPQCTDFKARRQCVCMCVCVCVCVCMCACVIYKRTSDMGHGLASCHYTRLTGLRQLLLIPLSTSKHNTVRAHRHTHEYTHTHTHTHTHTNASKSTIRWEQLHTKSKVECEMRHLASSMHARQVNAKDGRDAHFVPQQTADGRLQTADGRQQTADKRKMVETHSLSFCLSCFLAGCSLNSLS
jgi:hypothetical protein